MFYQQQHRISVKVESPVIEVPFHSSQLVNSLDEPFDRMWVINVGNISF
jgi:hypothetical protein